MKTQITIITQISYLADITEKTQSDMERAASNIEKYVSPSTSAYELALSCYIGRVELQNQVTQVFTQPACRICGCTEDNCEQCIEAQGHACQWVEKDLCSRCAAPFKTDDIVREKATGKIHTVVRYGLIDLQHVGEGTPPFLDVKDDGGLVYEYQNPEEYELVTSSGDGAQTQ